MDPEAPSACSTDSPTPSPAATSGYPGCEGYIFDIGDGVCDYTLNNEECAWDGGESSYNRQQRESLMMRSETHEDLFGVPCISLRVTPRLASKRSIFASRSECKDRRKNVVQVCMECLQYITAPRDLDVLARIATLPIIGVHEIKPTEIRPFWWFPVLYNMNFWVQKHLVREIAKLPSCLSAKSNSRRLCRGHVSQLSGISFCTKAHDYEREELR